MDFSRLVYAAGGHPSIVGPIKQQETPGLAAMAGGLRHHLPRASVTEAPNHLYNAENPWHAGMTAHGGSTQTRAITTLWRIISTDRITAVQGHRSKQVFAVGVSKIFGTDYYPSVN